MLKRIFGPKWEGVVGGLELHKLYSSEVLLWWVNQGE